MSKLEKNIETIAIITDAIITDGNGNKRYIEEKEIRNATYADFANADYDYAFMGLEKVGEDENGYDLFEGDEFEGQKTWEEIEDIETDWYCVEYWDGNNYHCDVFENYNTEEMVIERDCEREPSPLYYYCYNLKKENGDIIETTQSNMSGGLSPYYNEENCEW